MPNKDKEKIATSPSATQNDESQNGNLDKKTHFVTSESIGNLEVKGNKKIEDEALIGGADVEGIAALLKETLDTQEVKPVITEIGAVAYVGDGVCKITGLPTAKMENIVRIQSQTGQEVKALILGIAKDNIEAVILGDYSFIRQGDVVISEGRKLQTPVGDACLGRIMSPLGIPLDGLGAIHTTTFSDVEYPAPGVAARRPVEDQLHTGVMIVDTLVPLGKGQRELVIGDRKSGKTRLMAEFIVNQKNENVKCVYVAIGAQKAKVRQFEEFLRQKGALEYTCIIAGFSDDPPSLNYIAPYVGAAVGEYYMYHDQEVIVIYDDLSKQAKAYRQMSLLLKRSPGRDAYPGDIFYLHSRLLERSARLMPNYGGGSLTAFPMAETQNGDVSEYICTNLMSITDGHIYLDINYMHEGILPPVNASVSVSRIGGGIQVPVLRKLGEIASKQTARFSEVKSFENINTEISDETEKEIRVGKHLLEVFAQEFDVCLTDDEKIILLHLVTSGKSHDLEIVALRKIKIELIKFYRAGPYTDFKERVLKEKDLDNITAEIESIIADYIKQSTVEGAQFILTALVPKEKAMPIVPDSGSSGAAAVSNVPGFTPPPAEPK